MIDCTRRVSAFKRYRFEYLCIRYRSDDQFVRYGEILLCVCVCGGGVCVVCVCGV
jgi:hypothetical protein